MACEPMETKECFLRTYSGLNDIAGVVLGKVRAGSWVACAGSSRGSLGYWRQESCSERRHLGETGQNVSEVGKFDSVLPFCCNILTKVG